jgi:probable F420-dependent oxidoreductase
LATGEGIAAIAACAEGLGFGSVWVGDHIAMPLTIESRYPYAESGKILWNPEHPRLDVFMVLSWAGAATRKVRLGTSVLVLPMRPPLLVAKAVGTLDYLTGGRMVLGVGVGWLEEEFTLLGQPFGGRSARFVESIRLLRACWSPGPVTFTGRFYQCPPFAMDPKPPQGARLPVLGGGESDGALRRVAEVCDGWHPLNLSPKQIEERLARLRDYATRFGRSFSNLILTARVGSTTPITGDLASQYEALGIRTLVTDIDYTDAKLPDALHRLKQRAELLGLSARVQGKRRHGTESP